MATKSVIPEANLLYPLIFGQQRQGVRTNLAICDLICTKWKKEGDPVTSTTLFSHFEQLIHKPDQFEWLVKAMLGEETYQKVQAGEQLVISVDKETGKAYFMIATKEHIEEVEKYTEEPRHIEAGKSVEELMDKYLYLATPFMKVGLDNNLELLLTIMGHCAEGGIL